jgi:hypothetical protein
MRSSGFDEFCTARQFYHERLGRPSQAPVMYFRVMPDRFLLKELGANEASPGAWRIRPISHKQHGLTILLPGQRDFQSFQSPSSIVGYDKKTSFVPSGFGYFGE